MPEIKSQHILFPDINSRDWYLMTCWPARKCGEAPGVFLCPDGAQVHVQLEDVWIFSPSTDEDYRAAAKRIHGVEGECEIDSNAVVSRSEDQDGERGAYVQAWVWVGRADV